MYTCAHPYVHNHCLKPCLQEPCSQDSQIWFSCSPANHSITRGLQAGRHQRGMGTLRWVKWVQSAVWKRLVRPSLLSNLFSPAAKEPISSGFSFQISQHAMARRLRTVYLEKPRKIVCIIRAGTRAAVEGVLRKEPWACSSRQLRGPTTRLRSTRPGPKNNRGQWLGRRTSTVASLAPSLGNNCLDRPPLF